MEPSPLAQYIRTSTRADLDRLIRAHIDFVYAAAVRQLRDPHLAQDVTQAVFLVLAKRAKSIRHESALPGWLFKTTRYAAANAVRMEQRRRKHEQAAAAQRPESAMPKFQSDTDPMMSLLDQAIAHLGQADRQIILLRYLQNREVADVAAILNINEVTARKRLSRAVERLRQIFARRGHAIESTTLATTLTTAAAQSAPAQLTASVLSATATPTATTIAQGLHWMLLLAQTKTIAIITAIAIVLVAGTTKVINQSIQQPVAMTSAPAQPVISPATQPDHKISFTVTCVDSAGNRIPAAQVYLAQSLATKDDSTTTSSWGPITADANGIAQFTELPSPPPGATMLQRTIYACLPGKQVGFTSQDGSNGEPQFSSSLTLALGPSFTFHGRIAVPPGHKPELVTVKTSSILIRIPTEEWLWGIAPPSSIFVADFYNPSRHPDGTFTITDLPKNGLTYLIANAPQLAEAQLEINGTDATPDLQMQPQSIIHGRITAPDGSPVANANIEAKNIGNELPVHDSHTATTDADGQYTINQLPAIYVCLLVTAPNLVLPVQPIRIQTAQTIQEDLTLQSGTLVSGLATDMQGKALPNVGVSADAPAGVNSATVAETTTDSTGRYTLRVPAGKVIIAISELPDGYDFPRRRDSQKTITIPKNATTLAGPTWRLPRGKPELPYTTATLTGRVVDEHGNGVANVGLTDDRVDNRSGDEMMQEAEPNTAVTDSTGHYSLKVEAEIKHYLYPSSFDFDRPHTRTVTPEPDQTVTFADLVVHPQPIVGSVSGIVIDPQGKPLENVTAGNWEENLPKSDAQGRFTVPIRSTTQPFMLELLKSGYKLRNWNDVPPNAQNLRLILYPESDTGPDFRARTKISTISSLLNHPAPPLHVDWMDGHSPTITRSDGKMTVVAFDYDSDPDQAKKFVSDLSSTCLASNAVALIIFTPRCTDAGVRALFPTQPPSVTFGIDQFFAAGYPNDPTGTTLIAYGAPKMRTVYVVSPDGTLIYTQEGLNGLDSHLLN